MGQNQPYEDMIFNSKSKPVPPLRRDIDVIPVENNGNSYLYFHDARAYLSDDFALDRRVAPLLSLLDGRKSIEDLKPWMEDGLDTDELLEYIRLLDRHRLLHSEYFRHYADMMEERYEEEKVHEPVTPGTSYPEDRGELKRQLDEAFEEVEESSHAIETDKTSIKALYAPHIDPRVALSSYVKAFRPLRDALPERVVLLATSHYSGYYPSVYDNMPFILSGKDFNMPFGTVKNDREGVEQLLEKGMEAGITGNDRAHRMEHSIELHLLFLQYLWNHDFRIVPILVTGFDDLYFMEDGHLGNQIETMGSLLRDTFGSDPNTLFLISGDLSHVGKKFGDERPANEMFEEIRQFDSRFLEYGTRGDREQLVGLMREENDPYRVCGFSPLFTYLSAFPETNGHLLDYRVWDEKERDSAVSFGSILYT